MSFVFEDYRGFDISDKIRAVKLTKENFDHFFKVLTEELPNSTIEKEDDFSGSKLKWVSEGRYYQARIGDYVIKEHVDGYLAISANVFEKSFARDI